MKNPTDPFGIGQAMLEAWTAALKDPEAVLGAQAKLADRWLDVLGQTVGKTALPAGTTEPAAPIVAPAPGDRRFAHAAWTENASLDFTKQAYLMATQAIVDGIAMLPSVDPKTKRRATFWAKQFCDAMSPANIAWLNPAVIDATVRTGGKNLIDGMNNLLEDLRDNGGRVKLVDRKAFDVGRNVATTKGSVVFRNELVELIRYAPTTEKVHAKPIVIVPPWINKFYILDLQPANSVVKYLTDQGFVTFVLSWRNPDASMADISMDDYVRMGVDASCRAAAEITGSAQVNVLGYCIGGTVVAEYLAYLKYHNDPLVDCATLFVSLVDFEDPGDVANFTNEDALALIEEKMQSRGFLSGREMADTFTLLRANDLIWSVAVNRYLLGKDAPAFDLLYWNDDATRMPRAMHSYYLRHMYVENDLVKPDVLKVGDTPLDLRRIDCDMYVVATLEDHIAPWKSVYKLTQLVKGPVEFRLGLSGHIAGVINPPAEKVKGGYWSAGPKNPADPDRWLKKAKRHEGSWWPNWAGWLGARSGPLIAPPPMESEEFPVLAPAPGTYVLERA